MGFYDVATAKIDEAIHLLLQQALSLSDDEMKHNAHALAVCYINKALWSKDAGHFDEALALFARADEQHRISGDKLNAGKASLFRGEMHCANADWEKGFYCFRQAFDFFQEAENPLWCSRVLERISGLYATHEKCKEALQAMLGAAAKAEEAGHIGEQVHFLCLSAELLRDWKIKTYKENVSRLIHKLAKEMPEEKKAGMMSELSAKMDEMSDANERAVREDNEIRDLLEQAKEIAKSEGLNEHLANCLMTEMHIVTSRDDAVTRQNLLTQVIDLLKEELQTVQFPKRRGHLMSRISSLYWALDKRPEALLWLKKSGEVFEKYGDVFSLAGFYAAQAEIHLMEGRPDDAIVAYRKVLSIIEGRSFNALNASTKINLASALRHRREFGEAERLLNEAEALCDRHHFDDFTSVIARVRDDIKRELRADQAPTHTLAQILDSLHQLLEYRPELAVSYLPFWYFAWKTELLALLRSGPHLSFMTMTDDVERFMNFASKFRHLADHFLMTTSRPHTIKVEAGILPIPPTWLFPVNFPFIFMKGDASKAKQTEQEEQHGEDDAPPHFRIEGPATVPPLYMLVQSKSDVEGEGHMMALSETHLPQEAIDLMIRQPIKELIQRRAVWCPTDRVVSNDPFLTDLRIGHARGLFPVYFDRLPTSDSVRVCGGVQISIGSTILSANNFPLAAKWRQALLKLIQLPKDEAQAVLLDLPELFSDTDEQGSNPSHIEIRLYEFSEVGQKFFHPVLLVRGA